MAYVGKAQGVNEEEESARMRIHELEGLISNDNDSSIVKRSTAHLELAALRKRFVERAASTRLSVTAILDQSESTSVVAQRTASREAAIERERLRAEREGEIKQIQAEIGRIRGERHEEKRRMELEERLEAAESAIEAMDVEDASCGAPEARLVENEEEGDGGSIAAVDGIGDACGEVAGADWDLPGRATSGISLPLDEGDEDKISPGTRSTASSEGAASPLTIKEAHGPTSGSREPGEGESRGEDPADERIQLLEGQIRRWRRRADELSARCEHLEEGGRVRDAGTESPGSGVPSAAGEAPRDDGGEERAGESPRRPPPDPVDEFLSDALSYRAEGDLEALGDRGEFADLSKLDCSPGSCPSAGSLLMYRLALKGGDGEHAGFVLYPSGCDPFLLGKIFGIISGDGSKLLITFPGHCPLGEEAGSPDAASLPPSLSIRNTFGTGSMVPLMIVADLPSGVDASSTVGRPSLVYSRCRTRSMLHFKLFQPALST